MWSLKSPIGFALSVHSVLKTGLGLALLAHYGLFSGVTLSWLKSSIEIVNGF